MSNAAKTIIGVAVIAALGYSGYWFYQANEVENALKTELEKIKADTSQGYQFDYKGVEKKGFPADIVVAVKNPSLKSTNQNANPDEGNADVALDGNLNFGFDLAGHLKYQEIDGKFNIVTPKDQENPEEHWILEGISRLASEAKGPNFKQFFSEDLAKEFSFSPDWWKQFIVNGGEFSQKNVVLRNANDKDTKPVTIDNLDVSFKRNENKDKDTQNLNFFVKVRGADFNLPKININDVSYQNIGEIFNQKLYNEMGKSDFTIDFDADIPGWDKLNQYIQNPASLIFDVLNPVYLNVKNIDVKSNFGTFNGHAKISANEDNKKQLSIKTDIDLKSDTSKVYYDSLLRALDSIKSEISSIDPKNDEQKDIKNLFVQHSSEIKNIIPKFDELGTVTFQKDGTIEINKGNFNYNIDISKLDWLSKLYGVKIHSDIKGQATQANGTVDLEIVSFDAFVHDIIDYANRVIQLVNSVSNQKLGKINSDLEAKIKNYFRNISNDPNSTAKNLQITVKLKDSVPTVGNLSYDDFLQKTGDLINQVETAVNGTPSHNNNVPAGKSSDNDNDNDDSLNLLKSNQ